MSVSRSDKDRDGFFETALDVGVAANACTGGFAVMVVIVVVMAMCCAEYC